MRFGTCKVDSRWKDKRLLNKLGVRVRMDWIHLAQVGPSGGFC
jgi:hypothetical protein